MEAKGIILQELTRSDAEFVEKITAEPSVKRFYHVEDEISGNGELMVSNWLDESENNLGQAWIIFEKSNNFLFLNKKLPCGLVTFGFFKSRKIARITFALLPTFRGKGIMGKAISSLQTHLLNKGVEVLEADISQENHSSERLADKNGFVPNKKLRYDPVLVARGINDLHRVWRKRIVPFVPETEEEYYSKLDISNIKLLYEEYTNLAEEEEYHPLVDARLYFINALLHYQQLDYENAFKSFKYSESFVSDHNVLYWMARTSEHLGEYKRGLEYAKKSLSLYQPIDRAAQKEDVMAIIKKCSI